MKALSLQIIDYFKYWSAIRYVRLALGAYMVIQSYLLQEWLFMGLGGFLMLQSFTNTGCNGGQCISPKRVK